MRFQNRITLERIDSDYSESGEAVERFVKLRDMWAEVTEEKNQDEHTLTVRCNRITVEPLLNSALWRGRRYVISSTENEPKITTFVAIGRATNP